MTSEYNRGDFLLAEQIGRRILTQEPTNLGVHYLLGNIYAKYGKFDRASAEYKYCTQQGYGSQIGKFSQQALEQLRQRQSQEAQSSATTDGAALSTQPLSTQPLATRPTPPPDSVDLQTLEYKERILKTGADMIAANKIKLQRQIDTIEAELDRAAADPQRDRLEKTAQARIQSLKENCAQEELKITAYYQAQADAITSQKGNLNSQATPGKGDVRLVQKGSGLFVRNYVNYRGEMPLPPPPPELQAKALSLDQTSAKPKSKRAGHK